MLYSIENDIDLITTVQLFFIIHFVKFSSLFVEDSCQR